MYLGELLQYYQSCNNQPQSAQTLDFDLKSCFVLLNTSSRSTRRWLASVSLFVALVCLGPWITLLVVDLFQLSQPFLLCVEHLDSLCLLFSCLWRLSKYSYFRRSGSCKLMFHSPKLLSIRPFSHRFEFGFCLAAFCPFVIPFPKRLPSTQPSHAVVKRT